MVSLAGAVLLSLAAKPDIVYIMADDLGYRELGCFGQVKIPTPHLDKLAADGIKLTRFYSGSPVCAPTRYSLLTGKHQGNAAIRGNKEQGGFGPNDKEGQWPVDAREVLLSETLKKAGYRTGIVGKWALGGTEPGQSPLDHGFDEFYGYLCQRRAHNFYPAYLWRGRDPIALGNPVFAAHQRIPAPLASAEEYEARYAGPVYSAEMLAQACEQFIAKAPKNKPLFLYHAPTLPHVALQAPREWVDRFPASWDTAPYLGERGYLPHPRPRAAYAAMIAFLDDTVGRIVEALRKAGRLDNTLLIFTSDNGATNVGGADRDFFNSNGELRAGKMSLYEGGIRVPTIAHWPGRIKPGSETSHVAACYDVMATLCQAAGIRAPRNDGLSFLPSLVGDRQPERPWVYFEYPEASAMQALLFSRYKAIRPNLKQSLAKAELYDLEADSTESKDISQERPDLLRYALNVMAKAHKPNPVFPLGLADAPAAASPQRQGPPSP